MAGQLTWIALQVATVADVEHGCLHPPRANKLGVRYIDRYVMESVLFLIDLLVLNESNVSRS